MLTIMDITAREIIDSRGCPTIQARVSLAGGASGTAAVPSGASTGSREALELRDGGSRYMGRGVLKAIEAVEEIIRPRLLGIDATRQAEIDAFLQELDGTPNKSRLGANSLLAVSLANARAAAEAVGLPLYRYLGGITARLLPVPQMNVLNGGAHAGNNLDMQEFMILPAGGRSFRDALRMGVEIYHNLRAILDDRGLSTGIGDEGGFSPDLETHDQALDLLVHAIERAGYEPGRDAFLAIDSAASEFYREGHYHLEGKTLDAGDMVRMYEGWLDSYPLVSIEDGLAEDDWDGWAHITDRLGSRVQLVGDDLFVTNTVYLARGIGAGAANALLVKVNQIGTLTETMQAIQLARTAGYSTVISHRSGDTEDTFIADLSVATASGQIKTGAPARSERTAKYNRLLEIEYELGPEAAYAGQGAVMRPQRIEP